MARAIDITLTNESENHQFSHHVELLADTFMGEDATMGDIYRACVREYGRCQSKVYIDTENGPRHVGWFFVSRQQYEDAPDTYLRGAWVTVGEHVPAREEGVIHV
jgi:hypothetical protein